MHSLKAAARAWQRLSAGPCAQGHRWYERACHCHHAIPPAIHDDNDLGMTVLAQGSHSTGPGPAGGRGDELTGEVARCPAAVPAGSDYARRVDSTPFRYQSPDEDSARWLGFPFRDGDIVISTRSKTGTTWVQMICALLIFQTPELPAPLGQLSPWLDHLIAPREQVYARLAAQQHRRIIKTHTPLDGIPLDPRPPTS